MPPLPPIKPSIASTSKCIQKGKPTTITTISSIKKPGWVKNRMKVTVAEKGLVQSGKHYRFVLKQRTSSIVALTNVQTFGKEKFDALKVGHTYFLEGNIQINKCDPKYKTKTTSKCSLFIHELTEIKKTRSSGVIDNLSKLAARMTKRIPKEGISGTLKGVTLAGGKLYRYFGCEKCSKSIRFKNDDGKYYCLGKACTVDNQPPPSRNRKIYMMIRGLSLKDDEGNNALDDCVLFDDDCQTLLGVAAESFVGDDEGQEMLEKLFGRKLKLQIKVTEIKTGDNVSDLSIVGTNLEVIPGPVVAMRTEAAPIVYGNDANPFEETDESTDLVQKSQVGSSAPRRDLTIRIPSKEEFEEKRRYMRLHETYELSSKPSGYVLIISIENGVKPRPGGEKDRRDLVNFLPKLGMEVFEQPFIDVKGEDLEVIIQRFKGHLETREASSCMVIIMSHGSNETVSMADNSTKNTFTDIVRWFDNDHFDAFAGKPKIFIFAYCQAYAHIKTEFHQCWNYSDMFFCYPTIPGDVSRRNAKTGTLYIQTLLESFSDLAGVTHLERIMKNVQRKLTARTFLEKKDPLSNEENQQRVRHRQIPRAYGILFEEFYFKVSGHPPH